MYDLDIYIGSLYIKSPDGLNSLADLIGQREYIKLTKQYNLRGKNVIFCKYRFIKYNGSSNRSSTHI